MEISQNSLENEIKLFKEEPKIKRMKKSSNCEINDEIFALESLPDKILVHLLSFLPLKDLLNLTLVTKSFNTFISNNSKLLSQIDFLYSYNSKDNWSGSRKYPNVKIYCGDTTELCSLKFDEKSVKVLNFYVRSVNFNELREFLKKFENLDELLIGCSVHDLEDCEISPLPARNLTRLTFLTSESCRDINPFIKILRDWQINEMILDTEVKFLKFQSFIEFLKNQNNLEYLETADADFEQLCDAKFKLKSLKIENNAEYLGKFLQNHEDSLTELDTHEITDEIAEILNKFTKLQKLIAVGKEISKKFKNSTIVSLTLKQSDCHHLFPSVQELTLFQCNLTTINDMTNLQKLTLCDTQLGEISIPTVKVLSLKDVTRNVQRPFKFETSNLDELEIFGSEFPQKWIINYLDRNETNLQRFKIAHCIITNKLATAIKRNRLKIKTFEIKGCHKKSKEDKWGSPFDFDDLKKLFVM